MTTPKEPPVLLSALEIQLAYSEEAALKHFNATRRLKRILEDAGAVVTFIHADLLVEGGSLEKYEAIINDFWAKEGR